MMSTIRDFVPLSRLGQGTYSTVYKVRRINDQKTYALKKVKMNQLSTKEKENALNEIRILASIDSPSIVSYKQAFFDQTINVLCIVMEYADEGDLHHVITQKKNKKSLFSQNEIWFAAQNILVALENLHSRGIMHRDLKSANVFKSKTGYKLGDLNVSKVVSGQLAYTQTGTPYYASPQVWRDEPYDAKSDIWSLGCIVFQMASLRPPFQGKTMQDLFKSIQSKPIPSIPSCYSTQLVQLIHICLKKKPSQRLTATQLLLYPNFQQKFTFNKLSSQLKENHNVSRKQKLLNTIKLPSDLSKLKDKLPNSKYQKQSKSFVALKSFDNLDQGFKSPKNGNQNILNKSQIYKTPPAKPFASEQKLPKTPVNEIKLDSKPNGLIAKYSDRLHMSQNKSNKVERPVQRNYLNIERYIPQQVSKRPSQNSIPKTQKAIPRKEIYQSLAPMSSQPYLRSDIDQLRQKLVKKSRVHSNKPSPSWWA